MKSKTKGTKINTPNTVRLNEPPNKFAKLFLEANGFKLVEGNNHFANDMCGVVVNKENYEVANNNGDVMYSADINIYWLIGYLTWSGYMPLNYNKF